jgi:hypothetical protein
MIITWALVLPHFIFIFPFTGKFMHEYDITMYPYYWFDKLREKNDDDSEEHFNDLMNAGEDKRGNPIF